MNTTSQHHPLTVARLGFGAGRLPARSWSGPASELIRAAPQKQLAAA